VYNQLGDAALHIDYDRFRGILVPLNSSCIDWVAHNGIYNILKTAGFPLDLVMLAYERTQVVDWIKCRQDAMRITNGMAGYSHKLVDFFRYDYRSGDIDDLPLFSLVVVLNPMLAMYPFVSWPSLVRRIFL